MMILLFCVIMIPPNVVPHIRIGAGGDITKAFVLKYFRTKAAMLFAVPPEFAYDKYAHSPTIRENLFLLRYRVPCNGGHPARHNDKEFPLCVPPAAPGGVPNIAFMSRLSNPTLSVFPAIVVLVPFYAIECVKLSDTISQNFENVKSKFFVFWKKSLHRPREKKRKKRLF